MWPKFKKSKSDEESILHPVEAPIDVENENIDKLDAVTDEEMVDVETLVKKLEKETTEENQSEVAEEIDIQEPKHVLKSQWLRSRTVKLSLLKF